ncbi:MAG: endonuclease [Candidatus Brocadiia bacterium]
MTRYARIIEDIFHSNYSKGQRTVEFSRSDIVESAENLGITLPKNLGDVIYTFRYRSALPASIRKTEPESESWVITLRGRGTYAFELKSVTRFVPDETLVKTKVPDATPGVVARYALSDEQALLARLRYNRLIDIFTGVTCYSIQNHLRTTVTGIGQVETDEIYIGVDKSGAHYVLPVQAKGGKDEIGVVQVEQDMALCEERFPGLICRPIGAQFMQDDVIALFEFDFEDDQGVVKLEERHYRLVPQEELTEAELRKYRDRAPGL